MNFGLLMQPINHAVGTQTIFRIVLEEEIPLLNGQFKVLWIVLRVKIRLSRSGHGKEGWWHRLIGCLVNYNLAFVLGIKAVVGCELVTVYHITVGQGTSCSGISSRDDIKDFIKLERLI